jgi:hypothetical protein
VQPEPLVASAAHGTVVKVEAIDVDVAAPTHQATLPSRAHKNRQPYRLPNPLDARELYLKYTTPGQER